MEDKKSAISDGNSALSCEGCGLPPRIGKDGSILPLKRCTRCRLAWYHDVNCQRKHYRKHKKICLSSIGPNGTAGTVPLPSQPAGLLQVSIVKREGRGRCLIAQSAFERGRRIQAKTTGRGEWEPLVPPVLLEIHRSTRCAYCFRRITDLSYHFDGVRNVAQYPVLFCSTSCRDIGRTCFFDQEVDVVGRLYSDSESKRKGPPRILPTAILLYRILCALGSKDEDASMSSSRILSELDQLQQSAPDLRSDHGLDSFHHTQAVAATVVSLVQCSSPKTAACKPALLPLEDLTKIIGKLKINGFSVCDGESVALGIGLYPGTPSAMNHSCNPNVIQTFQYGKQRLPTLMLTACRDIQPIQEICISYIDQDSPRKIRRKRLKRDYQFWCTCEFCEDNERESHLLGLRLSNKGSNLPTVTTLEAALFGTDEGYTCNSFIIDKSKIHIDILRKICSYSLSSSLRELEMAFETAKSICTPDSWFVQESGECLVQAYLDMFEKDICQENLSEQRKYAARALSILEELQKSTSTSCIDGRSPLRISILSYKAAKLRLFLFPDPRQSISELQSILQSLSMYFPENHEIIMGIHEDLLQATL